MADLQALARVALASFRDSFAAQLDELGALTAPLNPHVSGYKAGENTPFGARMIKGAHVTGHFTTADLVWSGRARFWVTVGLTEDGSPAVLVSLTGFGIMEGFWPEMGIKSGNVAVPARILAQNIAKNIVAERYSRLYGWV